MNSHQFACSGDQESTQRSLRKKKSSRHTSVIPAKAGIHAFPNIMKKKSFPPKPNMARPAGLTLRQTAAQPKTKEMTPWHG